MRPEIKSYNINLVSSRFIESRAILLLRTVFDESQVPLNISKSTTTSTVISKLVQYSRLSLQTRFYAVVYHV